MSQRNGLVVQLATLIVLVLVGVFTWWTDHKTSNKLETIHVEVNSNMKAQVREVRELRSQLDDLREQFRDATGHKPE